MGLYLMYKPIEVVVFCNCTVVVNPVPTVFAEGISTHVTGYVALICITMLH